MPTLKLNATPQAKRLWETVPNEYRLKILNNVWCGGCRSSGGIVIQGMQVKRGDLLLKGACSRCGHAVARLIETSDS